MTFLVNVCYFYCRYVSEFYVAPLDTDFNQPFPEDSQRKVDPPDFEMYKCYSNTQSHKINDGDQNEMFWQELQRSSKNYFEPKVTATQSQEYESWLNGATLKTQI